MRCVARINFFFLTFVRFLSFYIYRPITTEIKGDYLKPTSKAKVNCLFCFVWFLSLHIKLLLQIVATKLQYSPVVKETPASVFHASEKPKAGVERRHMVLHSEILAVLTQSVLDHVSYYYRFRCCYCNWSCVYWFSSF